MGIQDTKAREYTCDHDACDTVRTAVIGVSPKGVLFTVDPLTLGTLGDDGKVLEGHEDAGQGYACQQSHVGRAVAAVIERDSLRADAERGAEQDGPDSADEPDETGALPDDITEANDGHGTVDLADEVSPVGAIA